MQFKNTENYITTKDLEMAVNAAINLEKPLLVKGEPGTGKTELAKQVAIKLGLKLFEWNIKSTTKAHQGGTGIGLNTVQKIIHRARGSLSFTSIIGKGTCFTIYWPRKSIEGHC